MKPVSIFLSALFLIVTSGSFASEKQDLLSNLLPKPQKVELLKGKSLSYKKLKSLYLNGLKSKPVLTGYLNSLPVSNSENKKGVTLLVNSDLTPTSIEGYVLEVGENGVTVSARHESGLFYGCQTLSQLIEDSDDLNINIPACRITDYPDVPYRGIHLDLKHHIDSLSYYYGVIDRSAKIKINAIVIEFEDKLKYRGAAKVGTSAALSIEDFAALSQYAKDRNIEISPLVQGLGHATFILKHDEYKELRDNPASDWAFDPLNPKTYDLQFSLYKDAIAATPHGKYLHVGGDEVGNLGHSKLSKESGMKPFELQLYWLAKVCRFAEENNRIPIFWDDMVFKHAGVYHTTWDDAVPEEHTKQAWKDNEHLLNARVHLFPKNCIYMRWNYNAPGLSGNLNALDWYRSHQLKVMSATAGQTEWPMLPRKNSNYHAIKSFAKITAEKNLEGILCSLWDDCSPHFETYWRGIFTLASNSWNHENMNITEEHSLFRHRFYGPALRDEYFDFQDLLEKSLVFWETALLNDKAVGRNYYPKKFDLINLPDINSSGNWSKKYTDRLAEAKAEIKRYELINKKIEKARKLSERNDYSLELLAQLNHLRIYPAKLLLELEEYDLETSLKKKKESLQQIQKMVSNFPVLRKEFEKVFSKTRVLNTPDDYVVEEHHHGHLASGTVNTDWMYVYELAMNNKIRTWESSQYP